MTTATEIKKAVKAITGLKVRIKDNKSFYTVSNSKSHLPKGFGYFSEELKSAFAVTRLDGCSFDILK